MSNMSEGELSDGTRVAAVFQGEFVFRHEVMLAARANNLLGQIME